MKIIKNVSLVLADKIIEKGAVIFSEKIEEILSIPYNYTNKIEEIDGQGAYLTPGFIDIHIHGSGGSDTMEGNREVLENISKTIAKHGVTGFLPTTMTMDDNSIKRALNNIKECKKEGLSGARPLGVHMEGPFINKEYKGAQAAENIKKPELELLRDYLDIIKIVTLAPEKEGAEMVIKKLSDRGIVSSVAHSSATYENIIEAKNWGLSHASHLFNAMTGLHHRRPGIVGAVLSENITAELIADFIHINPVVLKLVTQAKNLEEIILVTDAMEAGGLEDGEYSLGGQKVYVENAKAKLKDGTIAGSVLTMDKAIKNMIKATGLPINKVVNMATLNPARKLRMDHQIGRIKKGFKADLVLLDRDFNVKKVYINGKEFYSQ